MDKLQNIEVTKSRWIPCFERSWISYTMIFLFYFCFFQSMVAQNACNQAIYDSGGIISNYGPSEDITNTYCADEGSQLEIIFSTFLLEDHFDKLMIFDGNSTDAPLLGVYSGTHSPNVIRSTETCLTLRFISDDADEYVGYAGFINCVDPCDLVITHVDVEQAHCNQSDGRITIETSSSQNGVLYSIDGGETFQQNSVFNNITNKKYQVVVSNAQGTCNDFSKVNLRSTCYEICGNSIDDNLNGVVDEANCHDIEYTCNADFYDDGGPNGNYSFDVDLVKTFCSGDERQIQAIFEEFELDLGLLADTLLVYDGIDTQAPLIGKYHGRSIVTGSEWRINSFFQSTNQCLTFRLKSGEFGVRSGWKAKISCTDEIQLNPEICGNGIDDDGDGWIDHQDPDCPQYEDHRVCTESFNYYIPPVWKMGGNPVVYSDPAVLCLSTIYDSAHVSIHTADGSYSLETVVEQGTNSTITLDESWLRTNLRNLVESNKGFMVESDRPIQLFYLLNGYVNKNFISVKGIEGRGKSFVAGSQTNTLVHSYEGKDRKEHHFVSIMATEDNTHVSFLFNKKMKDIASPHQIQLNKGQSYLITDEEYNITVSGLKITSDKDIVAISGSQHTNIRGTKDQDGGADMLVPLKNLGNEYVLVRGSLDANQDYAVVVAAENNTAIYVDTEKSPIATIHSGEFVQIPIEGNQGTSKYIKTSKNAAVYHVTGQVEAEVGMTVVPSIGNCKGNDRLNFKRFNMTDHMTLNLVLPSDAVSSLTLNEQAITDLSGIVIQEVMGLSNYSTIVVPNALIQDNNTLKANSNFQAQLLVGDATNSGSTSYISSYEEKVTVLDPITMYPTQGYSLGTVCSNASSVHEIILDACGDKNKIISIEQGTLGSIEIVDELSFEYTSGTEAGDDYFSIVVANDQGLETKICLSVAIETLDTYFDNEERMVCSFDTTRIEFDSIGGVGPYQYFWSTAETTPYIQVSPDYSTYYFVTVTDSRGCSSVEHVSFNVQPSIISEAGNDINVCYGEKAFLAGNNPEQATGKWSGGNGTFDDPNKANAIYTPSEDENNSTFYLYWELEGDDSNLCFAGKDSVQITVSENLEVNAGQDTYICANSPFELESLHAQLNSNTIEDGLWTTNGDGYFMPGYKNTGTFLEAEQYMPGTQDIASGEVILSLSASDPSGSSQCSEDMDDVALFIEDVPILACNDDLNISLNAACQLVITPDILLEGQLLNPNNYIVELKNESDKLITDNIINSAHIGQNISFKVSYTCGDNYCSGEFMVGDYQIPSLDCRDTIISCLDDYSPDILGLPLDNELSVFKENDTYIVSGFDGCSDVTLSFTDEVEELTCNDAFLRIINRAWHATDVSGNTTSCNQIISVNHGTLADVTLPKNYDDEELPSFSCTDEYEKTEDGYPAPSLTGIPTAGGCSQLEATYTDLYFDLCGSGYKIVRDWRIFDWCTTTSLQHYQIIMVVDKKAPEVICAPDVTISTEQYECHSGLYLLDMPNATDDCSELNYTAKVFDPSNAEIPVTDNNGNLLVTDLPLGKNRVEYTITDDCGNSAMCSYEVEVRDLIAPTLICEGHTKISLINNGIGRLYATSIDDGAYDNCGLASLEIRKMTNSCDFGVEFGEYVEFCCEDIGSIHQVVVKATDIHGNINHCMTEVEIEDKIAPFIQAPLDMTIDCNTHYVMDNLDATFGKIALSQEEKDSIILYDVYNSGFVGWDGAAADNCTFTVKDTAILAMDCGEGTITRIFTATDAYGQQSSDTQIITISKSDWFSEEDIVWPENYDSYGCKNVISDTTITGSPQLSNLGCSSISTSFSDKEFTAVDSACVYILRTWSVLDICQFNSETGEGLWKNVQVIKLNNQIAPQIVSNAVDTTVCTYGNCEGIVDLMIQAEDDCTPANELVYVWQMDEFDNGDMDYEGTGNAVSQLLPNGKHRIYWRIQDGCGNFKTISYAVDVVDCKAPTPICIGEISTALMEEVGTVTLWASDYNLKSEDNCTAQEDLKYSFSEDVTDVSRTFTCDDLENGIEGLVNVELWVTDEAKNQDYCSVTVRIEDHVDACPNSGEIQIGGKIVNHSEKAVTNVSVTLDIPEQNSISVKTDPSGEYEFGQLTPGLSYQVSPYNNDNIVGGVTTLDLILIQKHILGIQKFTEEHQFIAADINKSNSITGTDIVQGRKAILGFYTEFPNNTSWRFKNLAEDPNEGNNFIFNENYSWPNLAIPYQDAHFMAIKVGDVSGNADPNGLTSPEITTRSDHENLEFNLEGNQIVVKSDNLEEMIGFQMEFDFGDLNNQNIKLESQIIDVEQSYNTIDRSKIRISHYQQQSAEDIENNTLFTILFKEEETAQKAYEQVVLSKGFEHQWISNGLEVNQLQIQKTKEEKELDHLTLSQNTPNPFAQVCNIEIYSPIKQNIEFRITNEAGRVIYTKQMNLEKGKHMITLSDRIIKESGVYFYSVATNQELLTRKMIKINH